MVEEQNSKEEVKAEPKKTQVPKLNLSKLKKGSTVAAKKDKPQVQRKLRKVPNEPTKVSKETLMLNQNGLDRNLSQVQFALPGTP